MPYDEMQPENPGCSGVIMAACIFVVALAIFFALPSCALFNPPQPAPTVVSSTDSRGTVTVVVVPHEKPPSLWTLIFTLIGETVKYIIPAPLPL